MSWYYNKFEPTQRRTAKGGIRALSRRGRFGTTWWGQRWIDTLEGFNIGARLGRGKSYARSGQVLSIDIEEGQISAKVLGSRATPYRITIGLRTHTERDWQRMAEALGTQPYYAAKLMAGEMPPGLEDQMDIQGLSLFPKRSADLQTDCSCPDWSNPCKHIAAVYYLLAEEFDRDPFLLFRLRGISRERLLVLVVGEPSAESTESPALLPESVVPDAHFWTGAALPDTLFGTVRTPPVSAALPTRLGKFPFWRAETPLQEQIIPVYKAASSFGLATFQHQDEG